MLVMSGHSLGLDSWLLARLLVAIVSLQQVAVIPESNVRLTFSGCCATAGVFFS